MQRAVYGFLVWSGELKAIAVLWFSNVCVDSLNVCFWQVQDSNDGPQPAHSAPRQILLPNALRDGGVRLRSEEAVNC